MTVGTNYDYSVSTVQQRASESKDRESIDFLTLLIAQLTNQDPLNPMEDMDFTSQLAQLQSLEEQISLNETMSAMRTDTQVQSATAMLGKDIVGIDSTGASVSGTVSRVVQGSDDVYLLLSSGKQVSVGNVTEVVQSSTSVGSEVAASANAIGMWVEAGYDSAMQPVKGIVEEVTVTDGKVMLKLYGGESVSWDQVTSMRSPSDDELWYTLPDSVREKVESAQEMLGLAVTGQSESGGTATGIVANAELNGSSVILVFYDGTRVNIDSVEGGAAMPGADLVAESLAGYHVVGLDESGNQIEGTVAGAEDREDGVAVILSDGSHVYYDSITQATAPEK